MANKALNTQFSSQFAAGQGTAPRGDSRHINTRTPLPTTPTPGTYNSRRPQRGRTETHYDNNGNVAIRQSSTEPAR